MELYGRKVIYTNVTEITSQNVIDVVTEAMKTHKQNIIEINYLNEYYKGKQDILDRTKTINDYVQTNIVENRAKEIVDFKTAYSFGEPVVYSAVKGSEEANDIDTLNDFMRLEGRKTKEYTLGEWQNICGLGYKLTLQKEYEVEEGDSPFEFYVPDPQDCFVIYKSKIKKIPMACVILSEDEEENTVYTVYGRYLINDRLGGVRCYIWTDGDEKVEESEWTFGKLPLVEYPLNNARMGSFEPVIPLLEAINLLDSCRSEGIQQFIESLLVLVNCKLPDGFNSSNIKEMGIIELTSSAENKADIKQLCDQLDQTSTQTLKNDFYDAVLTICCMPNRSGGASTSDNGLAVIYRDGWEAAEASAKTAQNMFEQSEYETLRLVLKICSDTNTLEVAISKIMIDFTRNHYENLQIKTNVLISMLKNDKIHPLTAYTTCGLFSDPTREYNEGMKWYEGLNVRPTESATDGDTEYVKGEQTPDNQAEEGLSEAI